MDSIVTSEPRAMVVAGLVQSTEFAKSAIRKSLKLAHPDWSKKQVRLAVEDQVRGEQGLAHANHNEAIRRQYTYEKQTVSKSGRIYTVLAPPPKAARKAAPAIESLPIEALIAELAKRGLTLPQS